MIKSIITQWEENKHLLADYFSNTQQSEYDTYEKILKKTIELAVPMIEKSKFYTSEIDYNNMVVIDHGDYQGTQLFIIPLKTYQPDYDEYLITHNYYGSCSGCDTLLSIMSYDEDQPNEKQVKEYMTLALHLIQRLNWLKDGVLND